VGDNLGEGRTDGSAQRLSGDRESALVDSHRTGNRGASVGRQRNRQASDLGSRQGHRQRRTRGTIGAAGGPDIRRHQLSATRAERGSQTIGPKARGVSGDSADHHGGNSRRNSLLHFPIYSLSFPIAPPRLEERALPPFRPDSAVDRTSTLGFFGEKRSEHL